MKKFTWIQITFSLMLLFLMLGYPLGATAQEPIKVGLIATMSGPGAMIGRDMRDGALLAFDKFNAEGGYNGRKIETIVMDDKNQPTVSLNAAKKLIYQDKVFALFTGYSPPSIAVVPLTKETETPQFAGGVAKKIVEMGSDWIMRTTPDDSILAGHFVTFAVKQLKLKKLAILRENTDYGKGAADDLKNKMKEYNMTPLLEEGFNHGDKDFAGQLNKIKNAGADGVFVWALYVEGALIMRQAKQLGLNIPILASSGVLQGAFFDLVGDAAEGAYLETYFHVTDPSPRMQTYVKEYKAKFNYEPQPGSGIFYDAATMLINAIKKVGVDKVKVMKEMRSMKFMGILGRMECDKQGQCGRSAMILQVKNGKPVVVWSSDQ